jgi:cation diffusion facilitator family transporter
MGDRPSWLKDERQLVAVTSVAAAIFLTVFKLYAALVTNSLGILSETLHSGLDLLAAIVTVWAVHRASFPPDEEHAYGHGKMESLSALIETMLLLIVCVWIVYEAAMRAIYGSDVEPELLGFGVMGVAIAIDLSRWRALSRIAKKYESQALEADALHFSSDVLSSLVVIFGLVAVRLGYPIGDPIAAVGVALVVLFLCYRMGKKTYKSLVDARLPKHEEQKIRDIIEDHYSQFVEYHKMRSRRAGAERHIDLHLVVSKHAKVEAAHDLCEHIENDIKQAFKRIHVLIHIEPCDGKCETCKKIKAECEKLGK